MARNKYVQSCTIGFAILFSNQNFIFSKHYRYCASTYFLCHKHFHRNIILELQNILLVIYKADFFKAFCNKKKKRKLGKTKSYSIFPFPLLSVIRFFPSCTPLPFQFFSDNFWSSLTSASFTFDRSLHSTYTQFSKGLPKL